MALTLPGHSAPAVGFEVPLEMLAACHGRVQHQCETLLRLVRIGFSNALFPSRLHPEHGKTTAEQREQRWDTASKALEPAFGCRPKSVGRGQPGRKASFLASSTG